MTAREPARRSVAAEIVQDPFAIEPGVVARHCLPQVDVRMDWLVAFWPEKSTELEVDVAGPRIGMP